MTVWLISANVLLLLGGFAVLFAFFRRGRAPAPSEPPAQPELALETGRQLHWPVLQRALEAIAALEIKVNALETQLEQDRDSWKSTAAALSTRIQRAREPKPPKAPELSEEEQLRQAAIQALSSPLPPAFPGDTPEPFREDHPQWLGGEPRPLHETTAGRFRRSS